MELGLQTPKIPRKILMPAIRKKPRQLYTTKETAELLAVTTRHVYTLLERGAATKGQEGLWPYFKIGGTNRGLRIPEEAILRLQERSQVTA